MVNRVGLCVSLVTGYDNVRSEGELYRRTPPDGMAYFDISSLSDKAKLVYHATLSGRPTGADDDRCGSMLEMRC